MLGNTNSHWAQNWAQCESELSLLPYCSQLKCIERPFTPDQSLATCRDQGREKLYYCYKFHYKLLRMKSLLVFLCLSTCAVAQKMHVKVLGHSINETPYTRMVPGIVMNNGTASANCGAYGNTANCSGAGNGSSISLPAHEVSGTMTHIELLLLLPDGRRVGVYCNDHPKGAKMHFCQNPGTDELEANFSGANVKLTWGVGLDGKKKASETYVVGRVYPAPASTPAKP
jgi:hypothetical protein